MPLCNIFFRFACKYFAVLQAIGMTGKQVKSILMTEGLIYTVGSGLIAFVMPIIAILGLIVPLMAYSKLSKASIVERIREIGS